MNELLLFKDEHIDWAANKFGDAIDWKELLKNKVLGTAAEAVEVPAAKLVLKGLNAKVSPFIPDEYKDEIWEVLDDVVDDDGDYTNAVNAALDILDEVLDNVELNPTVKTILEALIALLRVGVVSLLEK